MTEPVATPPTAPVITTSTIDAVRTEIRRIADPKRALMNRKYFKTAPGEYGAGDEFVELYNGGPTAVNIGGWKLQYRSAAGASYSAIDTLPAAETIAPHGYYLLASGTSGGYLGTPVADRVVKTISSAAS